MTSPPETQRLAALSALGILDTAPEERFDHIIGLARRVFGVPMAAITFIDAERQWVKSGVGIESGLQVPRQETFCQYTIGHDTTMVVADALTDARFHDIPMVRDEPKIRFYAGHPLHAPTGERVGSLCIVDIMVRGFTAEQAEILTDLARLVEQELARTPTAHEPATTRPPVSSAVPEVAGWEIAGRCAPARQALGGFYDWHHSGHHVHLRSADVFGQPLAVGRVSAWTDAQLPSPQRPSGAGAAVHPHPGGHAPPAAAPPASFVTAFAGRLSPTTGQLTYVQAGYGLAVVLQADGKHRRLDTSGVPLGIPTAARPRIGTTTLAPGEILLVLNDGFLQVHPPPERAADRALTRIRRHYRQRLNTHDALEIASAWAVKLGHPHDLTTLAVSRN